jgi:hypothetical protein
MKPTLTKSLVYSAALDAAKRDMRKRNLQVMDDAANDVWHAEFDRLFASIGGVEAWIDLPQQ